jgi:hypothetical protein
LLLFLGLLLLILILGLAIGLGVKHCSIARLAGVSNSLPIFFTPGNTTMLIGVQGTGLSSGVLGSRAGPVTLSSRNVKTLLNTTNIISCSSGSCEQINANVTVGLFAFSSNGLSTSTIGYNSAPPCDSDYSNVTLNFISLKINSYIPVCLSPSSADPNYRRSLQVVGTGFYFSPSSSPFVTVNGVCLPPTYSLSDCDSTMGYFICSKVSVNVMGDVFAQYQGFPLILSNNLTDRPQVASTVLFPSYGSITGSSSGSLCSQLSELNQ